MTIVETEPGVYPSIPYESGVDREGIIMENDQNTKKQMENAKRDKLKKERPLVYDKIIKLPEKLARGECISRIDIAYDYICNLHCQHCMASKFEKKDRVLTIEDLRNISEQADEMGLCQFNISGGEPLIFKDVDEAILALNPEKFHIGMSTNGHFLTSERAKHLKALGLAKVMISLDSIDEKIHDENRRQKGAYKKAVDALFAAKEAGLDTIVQTVVSHQTARTENTEKLAHFAQENGFNVDWIIAKALGEWEGRHDVLIDREDAKHLLEIHKKYPAARRDVFPAFGMKRGCGSVNLCFHISKYGDVFPCVFMHMTIGNIFDEPLKVIMERGMSIKYFRMYSSLCLAGESRYFINKYMTRFYGKPLPVDYREIFEEKDFIK